MADADRFNLSKSVTALAWVTLTVAAVLVQGFPGHRVPFFTGDLAFHVGTAHTMQFGDLNGSGPYAGLPSFYGGTFVLVLAFLGKLGLDPDHALMVLSWAEPLLWVAAAATLARAMWPARATVQLTFAALVCWAAGTGLGMTDQWVNAPNIAGQVFWPLFPRDVALMLLLVAVAAAASGRWVLTGVLVALCISVQTQVGFLALASCGLAVMVVAARSLWLKQVGGAVVLALVGSSWWWLPRVVWASRYGLDLSGSETRVDLAPSLRSLWEAYGLLLPLVAVGAGHAIVGWSKLTPPQRFRLWWAAAMILMLTLAAVAAGDLLSVRRALVLATIPLTAIAVDGVVAVADLARRPGWAGPAVAIALVATVIAVSVPMLYSTRDRALTHWTDARYGALMYSPASWDPVWTHVARNRSPMLAAPSDAAMAWFQTGRPVLYVPRPGYLKLGFDAARATGWGEDARRDAVTSAFMAGPEALCRLANARGAESLLLRSRRGKLGLVDFSAAAAADSGLTGPRVRTVDRNDVVLAVVPPNERVDLDPVRAVDGQVISVWQAAGGPKRTFTLGVDGQRVGPTRFVTDGAAQRLDFRRPKSRSRSIFLVNATSRPLLLLRVVAYAPWDGASAPAAVVSRARLCGERD